MGAGEDDLDLIALLADVEDEAADAVAGHELLARDLLGAGHEALGAVDLDNEGAALVALSDAGGDLADALGELLVDGVPLVLPELLDHDLLEGLGGDASEAAGVELDGLAVAFEGHLPGEAVELAGELLGVEGVVVLARGGHHRELEVVDEVLAVDASVAGDGVDDAEHFLSVHAHGGSLRDSRRSPRAGLPGCLRPRAAARRACGASETTKTTSVGDARGSRGAGLAGVPSRCGGSRGGRRCRSSSGGSPHVRVLRDAGGPPGSHRLGAGGGHGVAITCISASLSGRPGCAGASRAGACGAGTSRTTPVSLRWRLGVRQYGA